MNKHIYDGSCHCRAIGFRYTTSVDPHAWSIRACQCHFCRTHDALSTSDPAGNLLFTASDASLLQRYRFSLNTADFLLCRHCGVYIGAVIETPSGRFGIVNTHALTATPDNLAAVVPITYDQEKTDNRIGRRETKWTPVTAVPWRHSA